MSSRALLRLRRERLNHAWVCKEDKAKKREAVRRRPKMSKGSATRG